MTINQRIRKLVGNRAVVKISRADPKYYNRKFVQIWDYSHCGSRQSENYLGGIKQELIAAGIPAKRGHYANELSFFV
jgi:hypothetical protein